jgi:hypothetical protein
VNGCHHGGQKFRTIPNVISSASEAEESDNDASDYIINKREDDERHSPFGGCPMDASEAHVNVYLFSS